LMLSLTSSVRRNALKSMVCLSKYVGCYESYKSKLKSYGIKWSNEDTAFNGFLSIFSKQHDTLGAWVKQIQPLISDSEKLFLRFLAITGLRRTEAITSFNMVIDLNANGKLGEYYNPELNVLEHYKYKVFLRGTKNAYISFVPKELIEQICLSQKISYYAFHSRLNRKQIPLRFKEFRSYHTLCWFFTLFIAVYSFRLYPILILLLPCLFINIHVVYALNRVYDLEKSLQVSFKVDFRVGWLVGLKFNISLH
jgi:hypothetical protein